MEKKEPKRIEKSMEETLAFSIEMVAPSDTYQLIRNSSSEKPNPVYVPKHLAHRKKGRK